MRTKHPSIEGYEQDFEMRSFVVTIDDLNCHVMVKYFSDYEVGLVEPIASLEMMTIIVEVSGVKYEIDATVKRDGTLTNTSVTKMRARRLVQPMGLFQDLANKVLTYYKSPEGEKAWQSKMIGDYAQEIARLQKQIAWRQQRIEELQP